ncbi:CBS domain-containing protein [Undibacterium sp.]|uniref:CBS domain-containing protein n=1 Tax=Undibacterium sp. TaxID=1914977 RepID=UPI002CC23F40|nr:CBS domain-containing protein [Undibacterium sp.]HTD06862.1 CBS domain-containing protein [Undibacterium sp.]
MQTVAHILHSKPNQTVCSIAPAASVLDALKLLAAKGIGALLVMEDEQIAGIVSERDCVRKVELMGRSAGSTPVSDIMTSSVLCVSPDHSNEQCMALMTENRLRHLPVVENGKLIGLISIGDLVKDIISEQQFTIQQLEHYIHGVRV